MLEKAQWHFTKAGLDVGVNESNAQVVALIQERCKTLIDVVEQSKFFFVDIEEYDPAAMKKWVKPVSPSLLTALIAKLDVLSSWEPELIHEAVQSVVTENEVGFAKVAQPVRIAVTGSTMSPSIDLTLELLGKEKSMSRLKKALSAFEAKVAL